MRCFLGSKLLQEHRLQQRIATLRISAVVLAFLLASSTAVAQTPCVANIDGFKIHTVYVTGTSYNAVAWAYKHLSEESCLTPVTSLDNADAILELVRPDNPGAPISSVLTVTCNSSAGLSQCTDTDGNELDVTCDKDSNCSSYYGPSPGNAIGGALKEAFITSRVYAAQARIYTLDHKVIWNSELIKGTLWQDKLKKAPLAPACKLPGAWSGNQYHFHYRDWAEKHCGITFDPLVSIDLKANARIAEKNAKQDEIDEMRRNAQDAAKQQQSHSPK